MKYLTTVNGKTFTIDVLPDGKVLVDGQPRDVDFLPLDDKTLYSLLVDHVSYEGLVEEVGGQYDVLLWGALYSVRVMDEREQRLAKASTGFVSDDAEVIIRAPMPGLIIAVPVVAGQEVEAGQTLVILESMKMENELKAPRAGKVHHVNVKPGDSVEQNKRLVTVV
ncbi:MAG: acetyl-CoA carboxylase biotin carboxyl carrier protein subunit [Anaerolineae bacterium]